MNVGDVVAADHVAIHPWERPGFGDVVALQ